MNVCDQFLMLYGTSALTLQKMEGIAVIFLGQHSAKEAGHARSCAMKWTARKFLRRRQLPET